MPEKGKYGKARGGVNLKKENNGKLRIIPLGGLEKIGMNITAFEYEDSILLWTADSLSRKKICSESIL